MDKKVSELKLDWLSFTYHAPVSTIVPYVNPNDYPVGSDLSGCNFESPIFLSFKKMFPELDDIWQYMVSTGSRNHYDTSFKIGSDFLVCYNFGGEVSGINQDMGLNFDIPSHSLNLFFVLMQIDPEEKGALSKLLKLLWDRGCRLSRIDICFDDYSKTFRAFDYSIWWHNNCFKTHFRSARVECSGQGRDAGYTFYLGSRKANKLLRIYDKDIQSNGENDCIRYEFEYHSKYAQMLHKHLMSATLQLGTLIRDWFEIVDPIYPNDKDKCPYIPEWIDFVTKDIFCEHISDITVPKMGTTQHKMSRIHYVETYLPHVLRDYVSYKSVEDLIMLATKSSHTDYYNADFVSTTLRSMVDEPIDFKFNLKGFRPALDIDLPF